MASTGDFGVWNEAAAPAVGPGPGSAAGSPGLMPQQHGASPGGRGHFVPGAESGRPLELAHGREALSGCVCHLKSLTSRCASNP